MDIGEILATFLKQDNRPTEAQVTLEQSDFVDYILASANGAAWSLIFASSNQ